MNKTQTVMITITMALLTGFMLGVCIGMNLKPIEVNTGDTYEYYEGIDEKMEIEPFYN